ncbi:MAG: L-threonylcarbamoyladenylate synthase, partial [Deltaproteobacteria bacterium]|nr:L-threonylcarbamoyladenylate synthase [Deltaproteobacteria bacterium]
EANAVRKVLLEGGVMTYPTETAYALGGNALLPDVAEAVYRLKGREADKALLVLIGAERGLQGLAREVSESARRLMARFWPGPLTLVFHAADACPPHLPDARATIALRWSPHPLLADLHRLAPVPLIGTSANRSGTPSLHSCPAVVQAFPQGLTLALDGGPTPGGAPSTLVDTTCDPPRILRPGVVTAAEIAAVLG